MRGVLFDLPHALEGAQRTIAEAGLSHRCKVVSGDFFRSVPANGRLLRFETMIRADNRLSYPLLSDAVPGVLDHGRSQHGNSNRRLRAD